MDFVAIGEVLGSSTKKTRFLVKWQILPLQLKRNRAPALCWVKDNFNCWSYMRNRYVPNAYVFAGKQIINTYVFAGYWKMKQQTRMCLAQIRDKRVCVCYC